MYVYGQHTCSNWGCQKRVPANSNSDKYFPLYRTLSGTLSGFSIFSFLSRQLLVFQECLTAECSRGDLKASDSTLSTRAEPVTTQTLPSLQPPGASPALCITALSHSGSWVVICCLLLGSNQRARNVPAYFWLPGLNCIHKRTITFVRRTNKKEKRAKGREMKNTSKISKPAISRIPMKEAPWRLVLSSALLMRWTSQRNSRS